VPASRINDVTTWVLSESWQQTHPMRFWKQRRRSRGSSAHRSKKKSPMQRDAKTAYLFQCDGEELFAVSPDKAGANIPRSSCTRGWLLQHEFQLGAQDPVPGLIAPEPIIRSINDKGYYIWRDALLGAKKNTLAGCDNPFPNYITGATIEPSSTPE
jgi:hypothetical protein